MSEHDYDTCQCARCIRRRVWDILLREEAACREAVRLERDARKLLAPALGDLDPSITPRASTPGEE